MFNEKVQPSFTENEQLNLVLSSGDLHNVHMTGEVTDIIHYANGETEIRKGHNIVVTSFLNLVMSLLKNSVGYYGIQYWAVGSGDPSWDSFMPNPESGASRLTTEIDRASISPSEISFLNPDFSVSATPTNIIQVAHTFGTSACNGIWREFGLFGGNATTTANSGIMINKRHHPVITKTSDMTIERIIRFTLNLV